MSSWESWAVETHPALALCSLLRLAGSPGQQRAACSVPGLLPAWLSPRLLQAPALALQLLLHLAGVPGCRAPAQLCAPCCACQESQVVAGTLPQLCAPAVSSWESRLVAGTCGQLQLLPHLAGSPGCVWRLPELQPPRCIWLGAPWAVAGILCPWGPGSGRARSH